MKIYNKFLMYCLQVIRSILTDKREKYYNSKGIGCYMFRIDDNLVVDATMKGNAARFINHSCDVSTVVVFKFINSLHFPVRINSIYFVVESKHTYKYTIKIFTTAKLIVV